MIAAIPRQVPPSPECPTAMMLAHRIATGAIELPVLPDVAARVIAATRSDDAELGGLADLCRSDPALAAFVLQAANSSLFGARSGVVSLRQAVVRLGLEGLRKVAFVMAGRSAMLRVRGREEQVRRIYRHSLMTAGWAQELARARRLNVEEAFLCGLLHEVGRPVLLLAAAELTADEESIASAVDLHHAAAGAAVLSWWPAAAGLVDVVRHHHDDSPPEAVARPIHLLTLADGLARAEPGTLVAPVLPDRPLAALAFYPEDIDELWERRQIVQTFARDSW